MRTKQLPDSDLFLQVLLIKFHRALLKRDQNILVSNSVFTWKYCNDLPLIYLLKDDTRFEF